MKCCLTCLRAFLIAIIVGVRVLHIWRRGIGCSGQGGHLKSLQGAGFGVFYYISL